MDELQLQQARSAAVIAASNIMSHHESIGGNPQLLVERLADIANPILDYILHGGSVDEDA